MVGWWCVCGWGIDSVWYYRSGVELGGRAVMGMLVTCG